LLSGNGFSIECGGKAVELRLNSGSIEHHQRLQQRVGKDAEE
jgi:hypothetical protein